MSDLFVGLGSNLGDRPDYLRRGIREMERSGLRVCQQSSVYETNPVGGPSQNRYLNAVVRLESFETPQIVLRKLQLAEYRCGRVRSVRFGSRTLDLDLLWHAGQTIDSEFLSLPHPRMMERRFVLEPLSEIAPQLQLPQGTAQSCLLALKD